MAYSYRFLEQAVLDLELLDAYFMANARQKGAQFFAKLDNSITKVCELPEMYPVYSRFPIYRRMVIMDWLVFYIIDTESQRIDIHRVVDSRMKLPERLLD